MTAVQRHDIITERIVEALTQNRVPWRNDHGVPTNIASRQPYTGVNTLLLNIATEKHGFKTPWWATWSQWKSQGRNIKQRPQSVPQGSWGTEIVIKGSDGQLGRWTVYNLDQVEGGFETLREQTFQPQFQRADNIITATDAEIEFKRGMEAAYYFPPLDKIVFPLREQFEQGPGGLAGYYNSLFHEIGHWTEPRLSWTGEEPERELRAEMTSDFITTKLHLPRLDYARRTNHHDFLGRWVDLLCRDTQAIFRITEDADKAVAFILACNNAPLLEGVA